MKMFNYVNRTNTRSRRKKGHKIGTYMNRPRDIKILHIWEEDHNKNWIT
jgi:hypothetical protein